MIATMARQPRQPSHGRPTSRDDRHISQAGVIPWWSTSDGRVEVLLVTTTGGRGWTIPKGNVPGGVSPKRAAAREAFEEAGLLGRVGEWMGSYGYRKQGAWRNVAVYPMEVAVTLPLWPEAFKRERRWMTLEDAMTAVRHEGLRGCLALLANGRLQTAQA